MRTPDPSDPDDRVLVARTRAETLATLDEQCGAIFRRHPFHESPDDLVPALRRLLQSPLFERATS